MSEILQIGHLSKNFGGLSAVMDVSFSVAPGGLKALIGPNGAGKTTIINLIAGVLKPSGGEIIFRGMPITGLSPHKVAKLGIVRTFQNVNLFNRLTVTENILVGCHINCSANSIGCLFGTPSAGKAERSARQEVDEIMERMGLESEANKVASQLPLGKQRAVEIARALAAKPQVLLLDEPAAGLTPEETNGIGTFLRKICKEEGITVLLVEHNMQLVMDFSDQIAVLNFGELIEEGIPDQVRQSPAVVEAYLGTTGGIGVKG